MLSASGNHILEPSACTERPTLLTTTITPFKQLYPLETTPLHIGTKKN